MHLNELGVTAKDIGSGDFVLTASTGNTIYLTREAIRELRHLSLDAERAAIHVACKRDPDTGLRASGLVR